MFSNIAVQLYRRFKYAKLNFKRRLYSWELNSFYIKRIKLPKTAFFEEYFKIWLDDSNSTITIEKGVFFRDYCSLLAYEDGAIIIGTNVFFNNSCSINSIGCITIGDNCLFGENVRIYDHNHKYSDSSLVVQQGYKIGKVEIGTNCWIASNVTILKGAYIGENSVIGANCVISCSIPANSLVQMNNNALSITAIIRNETT